MITERDFALLSKLSDFGVMTTRQIAEELFGGIARTTVLRRLRVLEGAGLIARIPGLANSENAWALTIDGAKKVTNRPPRWKHSRFNLDHDVKLTELPLRLEGVGVVHSWIPEHEIRNSVLSKHGLEYGKKMVIPDGILGCEIAGARKSIAIELELNYKNKDRYRRNFEDYRWKRNVFGIWYFTPSPKLAQTIEKTYQGIYEGFVAPNFYWSTTFDLESKGADALVHSKNKSIRIGDLLAKVEARKPALTPAQGVSSPEDKGALARLSGTTEKDEEKLAPAS